MYKCPECGQVFVLNDEQNAVIETCMEKDHPVSIVVQCPGTGCTWMHIAGGEPDVYPDENDVWKPCIMMYGYAYDNHPRREGEVGRKWLVTEGYSHYGVRYEQ